jgi:FAD synthetase
MAGTQNAKNSKSKKSPEGKKVMVFGTFDGVHDGHRNMFQQAKKHGDHLVVVVARDATVTEVKGQGPIRDEIDRLGDILSEGVAKDVVMGRNGDKYHVLKDFKPDVVALGYDQKHFVDGLREKLKHYDLPKTKVVRLKPFQKHIYKSSIINKREETLAKTQKTQIKHSDVDVDQIDTRKTKRTSKKRRNKNTNQKKTTSSQQRDVNQRRRVHAPQRERSRVAVAKRRKRSTVGKKKKR